MLILKYFLSVGAALTVGLWVLSAHLESENAAKAPRVQTTSTIAVAPPAKPKVAEVSLIDEQIAPQGKASKSSNQSGEPRHRRSQR